MTGLKARRGEARVRVGLRIVDRVKNASGFHAEGVPTKTVLTYTSHETYLTMLVELGGLGLLLFVSPFLFLGTRALVRARGPGMDWVTAATLGSLLVGLPDRIDRGLPLLLVRPAPPLRLPRDPASAGRAASGIPLTRRLRPPKPLRMPRILFLYSSLAVGGAERQLALLAPRLRERGFEPAVATLRIAGHFFDELRELGIPIVHVGMQSRSDVRGAARAYRLWRMRPEIVFTQSIDAHVIGHALALRARAPQVAAEHVGPGIDRGGHRVLAARLVAPHISRVVAVSPSQIPDLVRLGYREGRIRVIPNGLPELVEPRTSGRAAGARTGRR